MAVADGGGRRLGHGLGLARGRGFGRGFGRDCVPRTWLGPVSSVVATVAVVLTVSAVTVAVQELWLFPWPPWVWPFLALVVCVIIGADLSVGVLAWAFAWLHAQSWSWS